MAIAFPLADCYVPRAMNVREIRRQNLRLLIEDSGLKQAGFAKRYDLDAVVISQILNEHRNMGHEFARKVEENVGLEPGAMDHQMSLDVKERQKIVGETTKKSNDETRLFEILAVWRSGNDDIRRMIHDAAMGAVERAKHAKRTGVVRTKPGRKGSP